MKKFLQLFIILTLVATCGPKKKVTKFENPKIIFFMDQTKLEVYKSMEKTPKPEFELTSAETNIMVVAKIEVQKKRHNRYLV
jgi:hypothetical protein